MKTKILILLTLVGAIAAQQRSGNLIGERSNIRNAVGMCQRLHQTVSGTKLMQIKSGSFNALDADEDARCFADCLMRNLRMITGTSVLDTNEVREKMLTFGATNSHAQHCFGLKPLAGYNCIQGWGLLKCICERAREFCNSL